MKSITIARFLNKELKINSIPDSSRNGLQFNAKNHIKKVGFAVDASIKTFKKITYFILMNFMFYNSYF